MKSNYYQKITQAVKFIKQKNNMLPEICLILGSGLDELVKLIEERSEVDFKQIPHFPKSTVKEHSGKFVFGKLKGKQILVMQGRVHYYEGYSMKQVTFPIRIMQRLGVKTIIVTNASGGINPKYKRGDLMLITDHINIPGMAGHNALRGMNDERLGLRFPDMSETYNLSLREIAQRVSVKYEINIRQGIYVFVSGPNFETKAEVRFLKIIGADAVGMSTVPEVIAARHAGIKVIGISGITNVLDGTKTSYEEVLEAGRQIAPKMYSLIKGIIEEL